MRIQPTSKSLPVGPAEPTQPDKPASPSVGTGSDRVELSVLSQAAAGLAPNRAEEIQAAIDTGTYEVNAAEVSHQIVEFYLIPLK
ncbi:MAG TPA: hypothetical protein VLX58_15900 [Bryobacteraceae bacterium]|nr:hypothetical protein [Bryobacteraceae bacterium]